MYRKALHSQVCSGMNYRKANTPMKSPPRSRQNKVDALGASFMLAVLTIKYAKADQN